MDVLNIWVPYFPPSSNNIYIRHPSGKGRILSQEARTFKIRAMKTIQQEGRVSLMQVQKNVPYELHLVLFFPQVENQNSSKGDRYKKIDLSNRIKLIEDTVSEAVGLDDSHNFRLKQEKHCNPQSPGLYVVLRRVPEEEVGLTKEAYDALQLRKPEPHGASGAGTKGRLLVRSSRSGKTSAHRSDRGTDRP
jgi:Holliday junction resolvase RusA-like endonuclease